MHNFIPTPSSSYLELGFFTIHYYALAILLGIVIAVLITRARYQDSGGNPSEINDLALVLIPSGIIGGRIYHVITSPDRYFGKGGNICDAFKVWQGGLGIWGAIAAGAGVGFIFFKKQKFSLTFSEFADSVAPALLVAQGIGRFGNWFNGELFGRPTTLPWGLRIPFSLRPVGYEQFETFHPTFLYEAIWCFAGAFLIYQNKYFRNLKSGQVFLSYIFIYSTGRLWIESIRIDSAHLIGGLRINIWVSIIAISTSGLIFLRRERAKPKA
ncbi:MAG: prolipoprotein diacylglyceryl transferase [Actinobacteria bacterium]|jgi:prolipoprotein diacylglyceryl transferase|nr:prolipoprotein diacylglyceryl transferase [Actinomycetota bacterium]